MTIVEFSELPFWIIAVLLSLLAAFFVLRPWLRPAPPIQAESVADNAAVYRQRLDELADDLAAGRIDAAQHQSMEQELRAALADDARLVAATAKAVPVDSEPAARAGWLPILGVVLAVPAVAVALYGALGAYDDVLFARQISEFRSVQQTAAAARQTAPADAAAGPGHEQLELIGMVRTMRQELESRPDDGDGWFMLGRSALQLQDYDLAVESFAQVAKIAPGTPAPLAYLAQSQYLAAGRKLTDETRATIDRVLELAPDEPIMLEMLAVDAFERQDYRATIDLLERGLAKGVNAERRGFFEAGIARARLELGEPAVPPSTDAVAGPALLVNVEMAPGLDLAPGAVVFVTAKAEQGPPMPLAVARHTVAELPLRVRLDAAAAMSPAMQLKVGQKVVVSARVSRRGTADRSADDVEIVSPALVVAAGERPVSLVLGGASSLGAQMAPTAPAAPAAAGTSPAGSTQLNLLVEAAEHVAVAPSAVLFVFAREVGGPPMPLAVDRRPATQLPALIRLDDSMAMVPGRTLSAAKQVEVVARLSMSGSAAPQSGDWEGSVGPLAPGESTRVLNLLIDRRIP